MQSVGGNGSKDINLFAGNVSIQQPGNSNNGPELDNIYTWIAQLNNPETREKALLELCKRRENFTDFAPLLWHSYGAIASLLQEICAVYPYINPANLTAHQSNRVCNALALLQCLASHPDTRTEFLRANIPLYLYNFLNTNNRTRPFEYLRLTSLGVIGALAKTDEPEAIAFLLGSEIIPLCLVIMESGSELSKTVATFIMQKLLQDNYGLAYICQTYDRFAHVATVLEKMVVHLAKEQSLRLLKHVIRCYQRLSDDSRARDALRTCLPEQLTDGTFTSLLEPDMATKRCLNQFVRQLSLPNVLPVSTGADRSASGSAGSPIGGPTAMSPGVAPSTTTGSATIAPSPASSFAAAAAVENIILSTTTSNNNNTAMSTSAVRKSPEGRV